MTKTVQECIHQFNKSTCCIDASDNSADTYKSILSFRGTRYAPITVIAQVSCQKLKRKTVHQNSQCDNEPRITDHKNRKFKKYEHPTRNHVEWAKLWSDVTSLHRT